MIHLITIITAKRGHREEVLKVLRENVPNVLAEDGCIEYQATVDSEPVLSNQTPLGPDSFAVIEKWESVEALQAYFKAPHMKAYSEKIHDLVVGRVIHVLSSPSPKSATSH